MQIWTTVKQPLSEKQKGIIKLVESILPEHNKLYVTSGTRNESKSSSGHSPDKESALDFGSKDKKLLYDLWVLLSIGKYPGTVGIGLYPADMHVHIDDNGKQLHFIEISKPDKSGFVKVVKPTDKEFKTYETRVRRSYGVDPAALWYSFPAVILYGVLGWALLRKFT
jgi:hypothetical protein